MDRSRASRTRRSVTRFRPRCYLQVLLRVHDLKMMREDRTRKNPASAVAQRTALWTVSIGERAGRPDRTPDWEGSLFLPPQAPIASHETDDRFAPSTEMQRGNYTAGVRDGGQIIFKNLVPQEYEACTDDCDDQPAFKLGG